MPKFTPEASSMALFGPGVIELANANPAKASIRAGVTSGRVVVPWRKCQPAPRLRATAARAGQP